MPSPTLSGGESIIKWEKELQLVVHQKPTVQQNTVQPLCDNVNSLVVNIIIDVIIVNVIITIIIRLVKQNLAEAA